LQELGVDIEIEDEKIIIRKQTPYKNVDIKTLVYPGMFRNNIM
jgi:UDP-N-acetylglucosamine 1-carboxyvinyltransferase